MIAKGFVSLLVVTGVAQLCDMPLNHAAVAHFPYSVHAFIYRQLKKGSANKYKKQLKIAYLSIDDRVKKYANKNSRDNNRHDAWCIPTCFFVGTLLLENKM